MKPALLATLFFLLVTACFAEPGVAAENRFFTGIGYDFTMGKYGSTETTTTHRLPLVVGYQPGKRLGLTLEIPYVVQNTSTTVLRGGQRFPNRDGVVIIGGHPVSVGSAGRIAVAESQRGLGDISLSADYTLLEESDTVPLVRPNLYVKFPTADDATGLGTGEFDFGAGIGVAKWLGNWSVALDGAYIVPGTNARYQPNNYWTYTASVDYPVTDRLLAGLSLSGAQAAFDGANHALEARVNVSYWQSSTVTLSGYLTGGLTDASADVGSGLFASHSF